MSSPSLGLPPELQVVADEIRKQIRLSRNNNPRVLTWFNLNSGREHFYILRKSKHYEVYGHFYTRAELVEFCKRYHFDTIDVTVLTYQSQTKRLQDVEEHGF